MIFVTDASLLHLGGMPWARIGGMVGHGDRRDDGRTYTHVVVSEAEVDYGALIPSASY